MAENKSKRHYSEKGGHLARAEFRRGLNRFTKEFPGMHFRAYHNLPPAGDISRFNRQKMFRDQSDGRH